MRLLDLLPEDLREQAEERFVERQEENAHAAMVPGEETKQSADASQLPVPAATSTPLAQSCVAGGCGTLGTPECCLAFQSERPAVGLLPNTPLAAVASGLLHPCDL